MTDYHNLVEGIYSSGFYIMDDFLPDDVVEGLRDCALQLSDENRFQAARIGNQANTARNQDIRRDSIVWLDDHSDHPAVKTYLAAMQEIARALNQQLFMGLVHFESHFALYQAGSFYKKHIDQFMNTRDRKISSVFYLNTDWDVSFGGALRLYDKEDNVLDDVLPVFNRLVCFDSTLPHEVRPTTQSRLSIAGWMKTRALARS